MRSVPASFTAAPSGARLPRSAYREPLGLNGVAVAASTFPSGTGASAMTEPSVPPCTAGASPSIWPPAISSLITTGVPPALCMSSAT